LEVAEALATVLEHVGPLPAGAEPLSAALIGRLLATDVCADRDSPPFAKSLRDGYAVRAIDATDSRVLPVIEEIAAGVIPKKAIGSGEAARIFTGAPMPNGADAVVMQEDAEAVGDGVRVVQTGVRPGQWVFPRGAEMRAGDTMLAAGTRLNAAAIGLLASVGMASVPVIPRPRVSIIATGDELVSVQAVPGPGQIRNSNGPMLAAQAAPLAAVADLGIVRDSEAAMKAAIGEALATSEVVLLAGGVSAGKFDLVPGVLERLGVAAHFHKVRMKPGKPLLFGTKDGVLVFGLPGNPASAWVCFELFVRPALRRLAGETIVGPPRRRLPLAEAIAEANDRPTFRPARLEAGENGLRVRPLPWAGAPDLRGIALADALIVLPAGESRLDPEMQTEVILIGDPVEIVEGIQS
jgi:molybdopterin molybdotransferase